MKDELYDLVIVGAAAVGTAASIYAARRHLNFVVVAKDVGGEVALSGEIENWPGIINTDGITLSNQFHEHMKSYNVPIEQGMKVTGITQQENIHIVTATDGAGKEKKYRTKTVIIGSGIHPRLLGIAGEETFKNKGVTYCTVCDGPLYKGKVTATIGAGNSAVESALMMAGIAEKVYLITKYPDTKETKGGFPKAEDILVKKLKALKNVDFVYDAMTKEILGEAMVAGLTFEDQSTKKTISIDVQGIMVHIGMIPNSTFVDCVKKNKQGEIEVDILCKTSYPGIFAAGDVTNVPYNQIAIATGQGVTAALSAIDYLNKWVPST